MPKYMLLSIPLIAALTVGLIAYQLTLDSLDAPSEARIQAAPSYYETIREYKSGGRPGSLSERDVENLRRILRGEEPLPRPHSTENPETRTGQQTPEYRQRNLILRAKDSREYLRSLRDNAKKKAARVGAIAGMVTLLLGYIALGVYFRRLGAGRPGRNRRSAARGRLSQTEYATDYSDTTYEPAPDEPPPDQPLANTEDEEGPYQPYEPPIDVAELDRAHEESLRKPREEQT